MNVQVEPILLEQKSVFIPLLFLYNGVEADDNDYYINNLGINDEMYYFFIRVDGDLAGFAVVCPAFLYVKETKNAYCMDAFFVMEEYRRKGIGRFAAEVVINMFKGKWEICTLRENNMAARKFWKSVISEYTKNNYQECGTENDMQVGFIFDNSHIK